MSNAVGADCVKCGRPAGPDEVNCSACTWPFAPEGWQRTRMRVRTIVLDTSCVNARRANQYLNRLEDWRARGWVKLQRTPVLMQELVGEARREKAGMISPQPEPFVIDECPLDQPDGLTVLAGPLLDAGLLAGILFPTTKVLNSKHVNDIEHLRHLVRIGGDCFVTLDGDFIDGGKQERLQRIGIWVFSPEQAVNHLLAGYGELPPEALK